MSGGGSWEWKRIAAASLRRTGPELELQIPRALLGLNGKSLPFDFTWADSIQTGGSAAEFTLNGDSAPNYRSTVALPEGPDSL